MENFVITKREILFSTIMISLGGYEARDYKRLEFENTSIDAPKVKFE